MATLSKYTKQKIDDAEVERCKKELKKILGRKPEVFTVLRHLSKSRMTREIGVVMPHKSPTGGREGIIVRGGGQDMGFHLVYSLSQAIVRGYSIFYLDYMVATVLGYQTRTKGRRLQNPASVVVGLLSLHFFAETTTMPKHKITVTCQWGNDTVVVPAKKDTAIPGLVVAVDRTDPGP